MSGFSAEGELTVEIRSDEEKKHVLLNFGKEGVSWMLLDPDEAREFALKILHQASQVDGQKERAS